MVFLAFNLFGFETFAQNKTATNSDPGSGSSSDVSLPPSIYMTFCENELTGGLDSIRMNVFNNGNDTIQELFFFWNSDANVIDSLQFQGVLLPGDDIEVLLGDFTYNSSGIYQLIIWTEPVGSVDSNPSNDTSVVTIEVFDVIQPVPMPDVVKCLNDSSKLSAQSGYSSYSWNHDNLTTQEIFIHEPGDYIVELEDVNGCIVKDTVGVTNYDFPGEILGNDTSICVGQTLLLEAPTGFDSYFWLNSSNTTNTQIVSASGVYEVQLVDDNNCRYQDKIEVIVNDAPVLSMPSSINICDGEVAFLDANDGTQSSSYSWSFDPSVSDPAVFTTQSGVYVVTVTNQNGCSVVHSTQVSVNPLPQPLLTNDTVLCNGETQQLSVDSTLYHNISWSTSQIDPIVGVSVGGLYTVTVTDTNNCTGESSVELVERNVVIDLDDSTSFCSGGAITLHETSGFDTYLWSSSETTSSIQVLNGGTYSVTVSRFGNCYATDSIYVQEIPYPTPDFTFTFDPNQPFQIDFYNTSFDADYIEWDFGDSSATSTQNNPIHQYSNFGYRVVTLTAENSCFTVKKRDTILVGSTDITILNLIHELSIYPNPASNQITIAVSSLNIEKLNYTIQNELGQVMQDWSSGVRSYQHNETIDVSHLAKGVYFVTVSSDEAISVKRIVIQ